MAMADYRHVDPLQQILRGYNAAQESHSRFNVSKRYFSKYKMWQYGRFSQIQWHMHFNIVIALLLYCYL